MRRRVFSSSLNLIAQNKYKFISSRSVHVCFKPLKKHHFRGFSFHSFSLAQNLSGSGMSENKCLMYVSHSERCSFSLYFPIYCFVWVCFTKLNFLAACTFRCQLQRLNDFNATALFFTLYIDFCLIFVALKLSRTQNKHICFHGTCTDKFSDVCGIVCERKWNRGGEREGEGERVNAEKVLVVRRNFFLLNIISFYHFCTL